MHVDHIEREWKIIVEGAEAMERLLDALGDPDRIERQRNVYFDTEDSALRELRRMLRVRIAGDSIVLTYKGRSTIVDGFMSSREVEADLDGETWSAIEQGSQEISDLSHPPVIEAIAGLDCPRLRGHAELHNLRRFYPRAAGYTLELDETRYPDGTVEHEIEAEVTPEQAEEVRRDLEGLLRSLDLPMTPQTRSKYARLLARLSKNS